MAVNPQKFLPQSKNEESVKSTRKVINVKNSPIVLSQKSVKNIGIIKTKVIEIENILKGTLALEKKVLDEKKRKESGQRRERQEEKLETKTNAERGMIKMPTAPKLGIFDWIKNFIGNIVLGYFAVRLVKHLPKIAPILKFLGNATDFILDIGGKLLNGLVTFVDWGYKAYDATRGFLKTFGGEDFSKGFDKFIGAVDTALFLTSVLAADLAIEALSGDDGLGDIVGDQIKKRGIQRGVQAAAGQIGGGAARVGGIGAGAAAGIVAGAGLLASALGEGAFQLRKVATKPIQNAKKAFDNEKNPLMKIGRGAYLSGMGLLLGPLSALGVLLDVVGAPFRYAIELLRYPFLSEKDKEKQAHNLAKLDSRIREDFRKALNMVTLGFAFKEKGSFGNIYGNRGAQKEMMSKMAGGGITRGGKTQGGPRRFISKAKRGKYKRRLIPRKPGQVEMKPGSDIGGEEKLFGLFPNPFKMAQKAIDVINPFKVIENSGKNLGKSDYFGPILAITSKILLGQKPSQRDYQNVGLGINLLLYKGISEGKLKGGLMAAFAEGGLVDPQALSAVTDGGDISNWVAKSFKEATETNAQKTLREIQENLRLKKMGEEKTPPSPDEMGEGGGIQVSSDSEDFWLLATASMFENSHPQGAADVAQVIYNRTQYPAWNASTIRKAILNPGQFQPIRQYGGTAAWSKIKTKEDAIRFSKSYGKTQEQLERVAAALLNKSNQDDARRFVGPRDSFRAESYERLNNHLANETERTRYGHTFGFEPGGAMIGQFKAGRLSAAQVNAGITGTVSQQGLPPLPPTNTLPGKQHYGASRGGRKHAGVDFDAPDDGTFYSRIGGEVKFIGNEPGGYYKYVDIYNPQLGVTERIAEGDNILVQLGQKVSRGTPVAKGTRSTGVFHYEIRRGSGTTYGFDGTIDPIKFLGNGQQKSSAFHGKSFGIVPKTGLNLTLHPGEMYKVVDKDSVNLFGYDLTKEIIDIENKSQLMAKAPSIIEKLMAISGYAPYEEGAEQTVVVMGSSVNVNMEDNYGSSNTNIAILGGSEDESDLFESLYQGS